MDYTQLHKLHKLLTAESNLDYHLLKALTLDCLTDFDNKRFIEFAVQENILKEIFNNPAKGTAINYYQKFKGKYSETEDVIAICMYLVNIISLKELKNRNYQGFLLKGKPAPPPQKRPSKKQKNKPSSNSKIKYPLTQKPKSNKIVKSKNGLIVIIVIALLVMVYFLFLKGEKGVIIESETDISGEYYGMVYIENETKECNAKIIQIGKDWFSVLIEENKPYGYSTSFKIQKKNNNLLYDGETGKKISLSKNNKKLILRFKQFPAFTLFKK